MSSEKDTTHFKKTIQNNPNNKKIPKQQDKLITQIAIKYNISPDKAKKLVLEAIYDGKNNSNLTNKTLKNKISQDTTHLKPKTPNIIIQSNEKNNENITSDNSQQPKKQQDIDSILSDIIPTYEQKLSIELQNINLTFEITHDKMDTLKETFIRTITKTKSKNIKFQALKNINLKIYKGEKIGIIGYNGAGKSTLLKVITGIYPPDSGKVITYGKISPLLSLGAGFDLNYSGRKNIYLNGAVLGYDKEFLKEKEREIIEFSELEEFIDIPIKNYSSGMLAKLGFSIASIVQPDILIVDEILGVGDVSFRKKSNDKMKSLMDSGTTVILVSHTINQIREICDKAIWIDKGTIREIGEVNEVCDNYIKDSENASKEEIANIQFK
ncbi:MAG: ABC transporter ATP-binding protein [Methanobrevibacter sp.]|nr:ABC transporter ATP-binding protein [Methanobrevibacter sp.]